MRCPDCDSPASNGGSLGPYCPLCEKILRDEPAGRLRYFDPNEYEWARFGFDNDMTPADLHAYQARFDAEYAQAEPAPRESLWALLGIPLALIAGIALWTLFGMWLVHALTD